MGSNCSTQVNNNTYIPEEDYNIQHIYQNIKGEPQNTFHQSCYLGYVNNVIWYLDNGESPNQMDRCGRTPLHLACFFPWKCYNTAIIKILLRYGADPNKGDIYEQTPLHYACANGLTIETINALITGGSDVNTQDKYGNTSLHISSKRGFVSIVDLLLRNGAISQRNFLGETPYESTPKCFKKAMIFLKY